MEITSDARISRTPGPLQPGNLRTVIFVIFMMLAGSLFADDFAAGNELFDQGKFAEAKQHYEKLVESGQGTANIFYNLGNADYRLNAPGRAILNYERALALAPQHPEALANLALLREQSRSKVPPVPWYGGQFHQFTVNVWLIAATVSGWLMLFSLAAIVSSKRSSKAGLWFLAIVSALAALVSGLGVWLGARDQTLGIITAQEAVSRLAPTASAGEVEKLPAGSRVRILSVRGAWTYCELPGSGRGWVPADTVERVRPPS